MLDWKRLLNLKQPEIFGLDIGSSAVKLIQLHKNSSGYAVTAAGIADIADTPEDSQTSREMNTVRAIRQCLQSSKVQTQSAVCSVCGPEAAVRYFKFPSLPSEEIAGAVLLEAKQVCPFNINDGAVDYQLIPNDSDNSVSGLLVAATNRLIKSKKQLAENASVNSVLMDADGLALLNCLSESERPQGCTIAILNVGSSCANLVITGDNSWPFIRETAYAGNSIMKQIAEDDPTTDSGSSYAKSGDSGDEIAESRYEKLNPELLVKACQKLITDVNETLRYYTAQKDSAVVEKIYVCGGFALVKGFVKLLNDQLPTAAVLWNPFDKIRCDAGPEVEVFLQEKGPAMAVAAGLAMRSI